MAAVNLDTTNVLLGIMAAASVVQVLALIALVVVGNRAYQRIAHTLADLEARELAPLRQKADVILTNLQAITTRVSDKTERVDQAITDTIDRVDETADRMKHSVRGKVAQATGIVRGVRAVITSLLTNDAQPKPPRAAA
jgi:hypothetical protein